jgi:hypothetical protein
LGMRLHPKNTIIWISLSNKNIAEKSNFSIYTYLNFIISEI